MSNKIYRVNLDGICSLDCFKEATKDEMKLLLAIISFGGRVCAEELSSVLGVSLARVKACITLFEEYGVLITSEDNPSLAEVEYEFELSLSYCVFSSQRHSNCGKRAIGTTADYDG